MVETFESIASLLWPLVVIGLILLFRKPLLDVVRSAKDREWTLEVGGQKLSMKQLNDQQNTAIADLQAKIGTLHQEIAALKETAAPESVAADLERDHKTVPNSVLWVDDHPENNALITEQLLRNGVRVDLALSTQEGLQKFDQRRYGAILSDMGRTEDGDEVRDAGLRLLREVRQTDPSLPFLISCSPKATNKYRDKALAEGADVITASPALLTEKLQSLGLL